MKIRAAVLEKMGVPGPYAQTRPLAIREIDLAPPGSGEVLVRIAGAGLCHSDEARGHQRRLRSTG
jgi:alcohol dehydrogenase